MAGGLWSPGAGDTIAAASAIDYWSKQVNLITTSARTGITGRQGMHIEETDTFRSLCHDGTGFENPGRAMMMRNWADFADVQSSGTAGGTSTGTTWTKRALNTAIVNAIAGASIASSVISLPAGTYYAKGSAPFRGCFGAQLRLRNTTDGTTVALGPNAQASGGADDIRALIHRQFTITGTKNLELQYYVSAGAATFGLGSPVSSGEGEIYAALEIWRLGT